MNRIILGDCMEGMKGTPDKYYGLAVCDPEYQNTDAIGLKDNTGCRKQAAKRTKYKVFKNIAPTAEYWKELKRVSRHQIVWGGNYFGLKGGVIAWNKHGTAFGEGEVAICTTHNSVRFFDYTWNGMLQQDMKNKEIRIHPTQKPIALYDWIFKNYAEPGMKVLDSHGGSFSSVISAIRAGLTIDCYEIDKDYYLAGKKRVTDYFSQLNAFESQPQIEWINDTSQIRK